ncbi:MAG: cytochrome c3 family protein, partial [Candidatus Omnitrophica bacterium]|nr:cytochrome c3 family protein [Candidatus Omnitrophota bacterium]
AHTIAMYKINFFPEMKTRWDNRPDNIGHLWTPGCFRCHDDNHKSDDGKVITKDCTSCHTIIEQGPAGAVQSSIKGLEFVHPFEDDGLWKEMDCASCHSGN